MIDNKSLIHLAKIIHKSLNNFKCTESDCKKRFASLEGYISHRYRLHRVISVNNCDSFETASSDECNESTGINDTDIDAINFIGLHSNTDESDDSDCESVFDANEIKHGENIQTNSAVLDDGDSKDFITTLNSYKDFPKKQLMI